MTRPDDPTPDEQRRRYEDRGGDDELAGTVLMSGDQVVWAGPMAVIGTELDPSQADAPASTDDDDEVLGVADGSEYTPPDDGR